MLRIAVQWLLALSLILQGPLPVLAAVSTRADVQSDCMLAMAKDDGGKAAIEKQDCCKHDCPPAACIAVCTVGGCAFLASAPFALIRVEPERTAPTFPVPFAYGRDEGPPIRPPIV